MNASPLVRYFFGKYLGVPNENPNNSRRKGNSYPCQYTGSTLPIHCDSTGYQAGLEQWQNCARTVIDEFGTDRGRFRLARIGWVRKRTMGYAGIWAMYGECTGKARRMHWECTKPLYSPRAIPVLSRTIAGVVRIHSTYIPRTLQLPTYCLRAKEILPPVIDKPGNA